MARMKFICDAERCIECNGCVTACKAEHAVPWGVNRRRVVTLNDGVPGERSISVACMHCSDAPCMAVCPVDCFYRTEEGVVLHDKDTCIGCGYCSYACPFGAPRPANRPKRQPSESDSETGAQSHPASAHPPGSPLRSPHRPLHPSPRASAALRPAHATATVRGWPDDGTHSSHPASPRHPRCGSSGPPGPVGHTACHSCRS